MEITWCYSHGFYNLLETYTHGFYSHLMDTYRWLDHTTLEWENSWALLYSGSIV